RLQLTAFDLHLGIECSTPAEVERQGAVMVDARLFSQLTRKLPSDKVEFSRDPGAGAATVRSGRAEFTINVRDAGDFPELPAPSGDVTWRIGAAELKDMIRQTAFAAAVDDHRSYLNGVLFEVEEDRLNLVATDSTRLAFRQGKLAQPSPQTRQAVVPARSAQELARIIQGKMAQPSPQTRRAVVPARAAQELARIIPADAEGDVEMLLTDRQISFRFENVRLVSRLLEGEFPNYRQVLPRKQPISIVVPRAQLAVVGE